MDHSKSNSTYWIDLHNHHPHVMLTYLLQNLTPSHCGLLDRPEVHASQFNFISNHIFKGFYQNLPPQNISINFWIDLLTISLKSNGIQKIATKSGGGECAVPNTHYAWHGGGGWFSPYWDNHDCHCFQHCYPGDSLHWTDLSNNASGGHQLWRSLLPTEGSGPIGLRGQ